MKSLYCVTVALGFAVVGCGLSTITGGDADDPPDGADASPGGGGPSSPDAGSGTGTPDAGGGGTPDAGGGPAPGRITGVNLAGAEFGPGSVPGTYNVDYTYPTRDEVDYFMAVGMTTFRIPFLWERLQPTAGGALNPTELERLRSLVIYATGRGANVIIDPHNYARYYGQVVGAGVPNSAFANLWSRLAGEFGGDSRVIFGLMNEPHSMPTETWLGAANAAISAVRAAGATNLILVPGNAWTGAHSWLQDWYGTPNGTVMSGIVDPMNNVAIEVHQYLDDGSSGLSAQCTSSTIGSTRVAAFTDWARARGVRAVLGEFGAGTSGTCLAALDNLLDHLDANPDVWMGWTYWAAGPWWGEYIYTVEPTSGGMDRPQLAPLREHL